MEYLDLLRSQCQAIVRYGRQSKTIKLLGRLSLILEGIDVHNTGVSCQKTQAQHIERVCNRACPIHNVFLPGTSKRHSQNSKMIFTNRFPSPIGGVAFPSDFAPSIIFAVMYGLLLP